MAGLCAPLSTLRQHPRRCRRMTRGQCGSLDLHCERLALSTPCRSSRRTAFLVYMLPPLPRCSGWALSSLISPSRVSLPRFDVRIGLHIVLFEVCSAYRGRDGHYGPPPAQIRTGPTKASGSYLGCLTSKRSSGQGWRMRGGGSQSATNFVMRSHVNPPFWLRRRSVRRQRSVT